MISDKELVKSVLAGNEDAYSSIVNKYKNMVFSICYRIIENKEEAEDVSQEVFVKAFFSLSKHKQKDSKFSNWLYRIAYTTSISKKRTFRLEKIDFNKIEGYMNDVSEFNNNFEALEKRERRELIRDAVKKLKLDERLLIHMYYFMDCTISEISYVTNQSKEYIKLRLYRIREKLKNIVISSGKINQEQHG